MMTFKIDLNDLHDKNINYLIGAGASAGLFPTLALNMQSEGKWETIETLATKFDSIDAEHLKTLLFMYYYEECIKPVSTVDFTNLEGDKQNVIDNYKKFMKLNLEILRRKRGYDRKINFFTTNYDSCLAYATDELYEEKSIRFNINDGSRGFHKKIIEARNFDCMTTELGIFDKNKEVQRQINLIHLHGSAFWRKHNDSILVDYSSADQIVSESSIDSMYYGGFKEMLESGSHTVDQLCLMAIDEGNKAVFKSIQDKFYSEYNKLPIVNPTKWKFHETVFEEHYYQMLRHLSYELEKPNSVLITFGFSFADEHIRNLIKRSLTNPTLQVYICCYKKTMIPELQKYFSDFNNIKYIVHKEGEALDFTYLNSHVLTLGEDDV
ncbi:SIR2 family protein [Proteus mirabilis]|uniref:SIR2 family protein n=1 Tax=Proteus mirabilis TaxID=584 RepID=UPI001A1D30D5|nr:SIR2 family protein [Proteus mirabilis]MDH7535087.1 SIR2 family protein [Proteus mirabilis]MDM3630566.1 SIR2 family protein [Proteus mirabilis]MDM3641657.1 SIR2 family protein [Proteus mirabilis]MDM3710029.1 SIR2 family protein [Proteus mirabilis]MDM3783364.1 SIR2 family protein [Proteus mirabilis]